MSRPRAILFDAGNTLLFLDYARLAEEVGADLGVPLTPDGLCKHVSAAARAMESAGGGDRSRAATYFESLFQLAGVARERMPELHACLSRMHRERNLWCVVAEQSAQSLQRLREAGFKVGVVSNSDGRVEEALRAAGLRQYFDVVIDSTRVGVEKPDPRIFHAALEALGVAAKDALYVGDIYEVDVVGARAAGIEAILLGSPPEGDENACQTVESIEELVNAILSREKD